MYDKKSVGERIKNIRRKNGKTQEQFGDIFSASKGNVATWEKGLSLPNSERLKKISEYAGISVNELLYNQKDNDESLKLKIFEKMLNMYPEETHVGKSLRFPNEKEKLDLLNSGINRTLTVPILKNKIESPETILSESLFYYIADDFLDFYIQNHKSNSNIIHYIEKELYNLHSHYTEYNFLDFHHELHNIFKDITLIFSESDSGVDINLLSDLDELLEDSLKRLQELKEKYPDRKSKISMDVMAVTNNNPKCISEYSFEINKLENKDTKIKMIYDNLSTILNGLIENNNDLYISLSEEFKDKWGESHATRLKAISQHL